MHTLSSIPISLPFPNPNPNSTLNPSFLDSPTTMPSHTQTPSPEENHSSPSPVILNRVSFNQDHACFAAATDSGFRVLACDPFREQFRRDFAGGGIGMAEMLFQSNVIALVGGRGSPPQFPPNKVMIWDDHQGRCFGELSFRAAVRGVQLRHDRIFVALEMKVFMYNFADFKLLHQVETIANPKGLCAVSQVADSVVMACPGLRRGEVRVEHYLQKRTCFVSAHESSVVSLALTLDGKFLATASAKGTLTRVFNAADGALLQELRRGANTAEIYSLAFSSTAQWLACSSDKGTVHVFGLKVNSGVVEHEKSQSSSNSDTAITSISSLSFIRFKVAGVLPKYFSSEWSLAQFRLMEGSHSTVAFAHQKNTVIILGMDGSFYRCQFDPVNGGEMTQLEYHNFLKPETDS